MVTFLMELSAALSIIFMMIYMRVLYKSLCKVRVNIISDNNSREKKFSQAPGPLPLPVIGNLNILREKATPFEIFTALTKRYGDIYSLTFGTTRCVIVSNLDCVREILNENGKFFGGRPDFLRYNVLFGGDRNNSLALCDWSSLQQRRRNMARKYCSPREKSSFFERMSKVGSQESCEMMEILRRSIVAGQPFDLKPIIQLTCANMFFQYMCSNRFDYKDKKFRDIVTNFDEIFWEINQGYAVDFLPWLAPLYAQHFKTISNWSKNIREFILERIVYKKERELESAKIEKDFTDILLENLSKEKHWSRDTIIFMLEDFIGGHSAVGNLVMLALIYLAKSPHFAKIIQCEVDKVSQFGKRNINLFDKQAMPFTVATLLEVLRCSSSPIVPHVATENVVISGYGILAGTIVFVNNYKLNKSEIYWSDANQFNPNRFLEEIPFVEKNKSNCKIDSTHYQHLGIFDSKFGSDDCGRFSENLSPIKGLSPEDHTENSFYEKQFRIKKRLPHFLPFSIGKRTCIGQKLVQGFGFILLANILQKYDIRLRNNIAINLSPACVALPPKTYSLILKERNCFKQKRKSSIPHI